MRKHPYKRKEQGDLRLSPGGEKTMSRLKQRLEPCNAKPSMPGATIKQKSQGNILPQIHRKECVHNNLILYFLVSADVRNYISIVLKKKTKLYNLRELIKVDKEFYAETIFTQCCILNYFSNLIFNNFHITKSDLCLPESLRYVQRFYANTLVSSSSSTFYGIGTHWILSIVDSCSSVLEKFCLF